MSSLALHFQVGVDDLRGVPGRNAGWKQHVGTWAVVALVLNPESKGEAMNEVGGEVTVGETWE